MNEDKTPAYTEDEPQDALESPVYAPVTNEQYDVEGLDGELVPSSQIEPDGYLAPDDVALPVDESLEQDDDYFEDDEILINEDSEYFDDDDLLLAGDDQVIHEDSSLMAFQQMDNIVSWEVKNLFKDDGKLRSRRSLRNEPPLFEISSSDGASAEFFVTQSLAASFAKIFTDMESAYSGVAPKVKDAAPVFSQEGVKQKFTSIKTWVLANKITSFLILAAVILFITFSVIYG